MGRSRRRQCSSWRSQPDQVTGEITPKNPGTAYAVAYAAVNDRVYYARCRVDVVENTGSSTPIADDVGKTDEEGNAVNGVSLLDTKATVELYRTDYTHIRIVPNLSWNVSPASIEDITGEAPGLTGTGAAVTDAYFDNPDARALFALRVVDDRTLEIIPEEDALEKGQTNPKEIKGSYTSKVIVVLEDRRDLLFEAGTLKLTVKKSLPSVKAAAVKLNSWLLNPKDEQTLVFTGGEVTAIEAMNANDFADWLGTEQIGKRIL